MPRPPVRTNPGMVWDGAREQIVMYGGFHALYAYDELWTYDGTDWAQVPSGSGTGACF